MKTSKTLLLSRGGQRWTRRALSSTLPRFLPGTRNHLSVFYLPSRTMGHLVKGIFLLPLFLTFWRDERARRKNAPTVWPRTGHGWVILISGLHTPLGPVHDYFGSRTGQYSTLTILRPMVVRPIFFSLFFLSFSLSLSHHSGSAFFSSLRSPPPSFFSPFSFSLATFPPEGKGERSRSRTVRY